MKPELTLEITDTDLEKMAAALEKLGEKFPGGDKEDEEGARARRVTRRP